MAHFGEFFHTASDSLATSGMHNDLGEIPAPTVQITNAKEHRLSRPNTADEIRRKKYKRRKQKRNQNKLLSKTKKTLKVVARITGQIEQTREMEIKESAMRAEEMRKKAVYFWKKWKAERLRKNNHDAVVQQINPENIKDVKYEKEIIGEGVFGKCLKKMYRGHIVAVKYFKSHTRQYDVEHEVKMINKFDHPGLPFVFGMNITYKPYFLVLEFYGIGGKCLTVAKASERKVFKSVFQWARILKQCCNALAHIHNMKYIHCDIKGDNIVIKRGCDDCEEKYSAVIIDFGKMKEMGKADIYKLSVKDQERYRKYHCHIAPEVVDGKQTQSAASDIYSFGQVVSLICHYNPSEDLRKIAKQCINGTPSRRPTIEELLVQLNPLCMDRV